VIHKGTDSPRLLVVSHDSAVLRSLSSLGEANCWRCESVNNAWEAIDQVLSGVVPDVFVLDQRQGDAEGLHVLRWVRRLRPALPIILISHSDDAGRKQEALRIGARDYLVKPLDHRQLELAIAQHLSSSWEDTETDITSDDVERIDNDCFFIGVSPIMRKFRAQAELLAEANVPVLILGESGSGKETTARLLHKLSVRSGFEFAKVNCAALPSDLLERELFGYQQNETPGRTKAGKLELCSKGTILLDEITEMAMDLQAQLLQVLQTKRFVRPGTSAPIEVDARVLASSTANMERAVSENRLREDLYYRLSSYTMHVPPLRVRKDELLLLSRHFMHQLAKHYGLSPRNFSPAIIEGCKSYAWPGNLKELETFVKRYLMMGDGNSAIERSLYEAEKHTVSTPSPTLNAMAPLLTQPRSDLAGSASLKALVRSVKLEAEKHAIGTALAKTGWNRKAAARLLKVSYRTLLYKIEQYQMRSDSSLLTGGDDRGS
jgi:two-component system, NtrC family, response regulator AtoC